MGLLVQTPNLNPNSKVQFEEVMDLVGLTVRVVSADYWFIDIEVGGKRYRISAECERDDLSPCEGTTYLALEEVEEDG